MFDLGAWKIPEEIQAILSDRKPVSVDIFGSIDKDMVIERMQQLYSIKPSEALLLLVDSGGGKMVAGIPLAACIRQLKVPVIALAVGRVYSMALGIYLSVPKQHRFALEGSTFLAHCSKGGPHVNGQVDLDEDRIQGLTKEQAHRKLELKWNYSMDTEQLLRKMLIAEIGNELVIAKDSDEKNITISIDEFLRYDTYISAYQAEKLGIVYQRVGKLTEAISLLD